MKINHIYADLHIHIGHDLYQNPVKISASPQLTLTNILKGASRHKGIELIGIVDCHAPNVLTEIERLLTNGQAYELQDGGIRFEQVTLLLGVELEINDENSKGPFHVLVYVPTLEKMKKLSCWLNSQMTNIHLSSQRIYCSGKQLQDKVKELKGLFIPAHVFTPFKSLYGRGVEHSLTEVLIPEKIDAIELGLSSDTHMADRIKELHPYPYVTNSDSHSLRKIGREYQQIKVKEASFNEFKHCLRQKEGRSIVYNFGMNPHLGKYYRTVCQHCYTEVTISTAICPNCESKKIIAGVADRIEQLQDEDRKPPERPPYIYQVPLDYIPGLGPKTLQNLLDAFSTEMNVIHTVPYEQLRRIVSEAIATSIMNMRKGKLNIASGGGGRYGKIIE